MRINEDALAVLSECRTEGNVVFISGGQLPRPLYDGVNKALVALGGKWNRKIGGHLFDVDPSAKLDDCINSGTVTPLSREGYFPTPIKVVNRLLELADIQQGDKILEPSAGDGAIAREIVRLYPNNSLSLCEIKPELRARMNGLSPLLVANDCFELADSPDEYQRIVMNPPFEKLADIKHVMFAWSKCSPGGRVVSVMSSGVTFRREQLAQTFRELVDEHGSIEPLPDGSFKASGTMVNTIIAVLNKPA
jgi:hypothetical protein